MPRLKLIIAWLLLLCVVPVLAQPVNCPAIVQTALQALDQYCASTTRNQACLGSIRMDVTAQPDVTDFRFDQVGDIEDVAAIQSLRLYPMDQEQSTWGVAMMRVQANLPDTLPGQNVTFLLFGDVELTNNGGETPMQSMYLATGIGDTQCSQAPDSGLLVQTPQGGGQITFNINGVDISAGSTVLFNAAPGRRMRVLTLNGAAILHVDGDEYPVVAGTYVDTPLNDDLEPDGQPEDPAGYDIEEFEWLPDEMVGSEFDVHDPLTDEQIDDLMALIDEGAPLCDDSGESFLPTCEHLPEEYGGAACTFDPLNEPDLPMCQLENLGADGDSDGDGYVDSSDACPFFGDLDGSGVDASGCPILPPDEDTDFDGVLNAQDSCPFQGDVYGMGLNEFGCPILPPDEDSDFDGVLNSQDSCPLEGGVYGSGVDASGCPILPPAR
ncbi:MAG: thrombospondin type 3 repeat-containing protein [Anaerolineae bacterium]